MAEGIDNTDDPFMSSARINRTMMQSTPQPKRNEEDWSCVLCTVVDKRLKMIQCDSCDGWFHFRCVGLTSYNEEKLWVCGRCKQYNEEYDHQTTCVICNFANDEKMVKCKLCYVTAHVSCLNVQDNQPSNDWVCHNCIRNKTSKAKSTAGSTKAKSTTSSVRARANKMLQMLAEIKELKDRKATDEMNITKKHMEEQHERDMEFIRNKFDIVKELDDEENDEELEHSITTQPDKSAIDLIKSKRLENWIHDQNFAHLKSKNDPEIDKLSQSTNTSNDDPNKNKQSSIVNRMQHSDRQNPIANPLLNFQLHGPQQVQRNVLPSQNDDAETLTRLQIAARQAVHKDLPIFHGDPDEWLIFISAYETSTKICGYRNVENLGRLQKCIKEPAKNAVANFLTFPEGVPRVIETLKLLFGNEERIVNSLLTKIRDQTAVKPDDLMALVNYAVSIQNLSGTLESSKMVNTMKNTLLIQELVEKLPPQIKLSWGIHKIQVKEVTIKLLSDWLYELAKAACSVTMISGRSHRQDKEEAKSHSSENKSKEKRSDVNVHQSSSKTSKSNSSNVPSETVNSSNYTKKCCLCPNRDHVLNDCPDFKRMSSQQRWLTVINHKLCRFCLGPHFYKKCKQRTNCGVDGCEYKHHPKLHQTNIEGSNKAVGGNPSNNSTLVTKSCNVHLEPSEMATLRYIVVRLYNGSKSIQVVAFLDEGATSTMVNRTVADFLDIHSNWKEDLLLKWTKGISRIEEDSERISLVISGVTPNSRRYFLNDVNTVDDLDLAKQSMDVGMLSKQYPYLRNVNAVSYSNVAAQIIIGLDNWKLGIPLRTIDRGWSEPVATKTRLGWEVHGERVPKRSVSINHHTGMFMYDGQDEKLHDLVQEYFSLENFGTKVLEKSLDSKENIRSKNIFDSTMKNVGDRYEVGLLWRHDDVKLPNSFPMAISRFRNFQRQLQLKPQLATNVLEQMTGYAEKGYVQRLSKEEAAIQTERTWYLPIFPRTYPKKPDKVRLVWDAAAKVSGTSLNSMLMQGPDNHANLVDILRRFRERKVPLVADIKEWYHQIQVREEDQDSQRFLWPSDDPSVEFDVYKLKVLSFGAACSPSTAIEVKERHASKYEEKSPRAVRAINENHYVDDWLDCFDTDEEAINIGREVKYIHSKAGFEIRNWISSSPVVIKELEGDIEQSTQKLNCDLESRTERVLGMWWCVQSDMFTFSLKYSLVDERILNGTKAPTKRQMLSTLMSIYDPLGFLASFLVHAKILLQDTWRLSIGWDEEVKDELHRRWKDWVALLPKIELIRMPRHYSPKIRANNEHTIQLHIFVDASELAYAAIAYVRIEDKNGVDVAIVGAKTKTAPLKPISIPKLELLSFVLGVRFSNSIIQGHKMVIDRRFIWTDSTTVLRWLRSDHRKYNQFVGARIGEILESTKSSEWFWVPGEINVADEATRWRGEPDLSMSSRWFQGPSFLQENESNWPKPTFDVHSEPPEEKRKCFLGSHSRQVYQRKWIDVNIENISKYMTLVRVQILVRRFIAKLMKKIRPINIPSGLITSEEFQQSEFELFRRAQYDGFRDEIISLKSGNEYVDRTSKIYQFSPYLDEHDVLRMKSRLDAATCISFDTKRPIILPIDHPITRLIVMHYHEKFLHQNHATVLNEIRQRFLIPGVRVFLKNVPKTCQFCKNKRAVPNPPQMADLPEARLAAFARPFTYTGIDYAGPFYVTLFRRVVKRWIALMTCLVTRAIHIEIASSLDTDSCIMCIRNFMNIRGQSREFFSDRGTNFVGCDNELKKELEKIDHDKLHQEFTSSYTKWNFNPPSAAHMGGVWERLVRSIKTTLYALMPHRNPNDELLRCWLMEVVNIVNSRPLTFVPIDNESDEALTPNHFLLGSSNGMKPPGIFTNEGLILRRNWRIAQQLADNFWQKWIVEYLPIIARRSKWFEKIKPVEVGDIVVLVDEDNIRNTWPKGRVIEVFADPKTNQVRSATLKTATGVYTRPVHKFAVLDVRSPDEVVESSLETSTRGRMLSTAHGKVADPGKI